MEYELVLAIVGISIAVVALGVLAVFQQSRLKREKAAKVEEVRRETADLADAAPGAARFFIAQFRGSSARFFRVYVDHGALLFLNAGPFIIMVDPNTPRGTDRRHWMIQSAKFLAAGLAGGAVASILAIAVIWRAIARNPNQNPETARNIIMGVLAIVALLAGGFILVVPMVVWRITRRAAQLDALPLSGLREIAETDEWSFRADADTMSDIRFDPLEQHSRTEIGAIVTFRHQPTGKWKIETTTTKDTSDAIQAFRKAFGLTAVKVDQALAEKVAFKTDDTE